MFNNVIKLGNVFHSIEATKSIIVKIDTNIKIPKLGQKVFNEEMHEIGYVSNIFGPTSSPFIEIRVNKENLSLEITKVYLKE
jgi:rRNA processing protein Gar1